jgi:hypothetical protein
MDDVEDIGVKAETNQDASESPREVVRGKSLETTKPKQEPDQNQSQAHGTASEHDAGEPMDEDTMDDLPGEGTRVFVQGFKTLDRERSEIVIPDSFDGAE